MSRLGLLVAITLATSVAMISNDAAAANYLNGYYLSEKCGAPRRSNDWFECLGYLQGAADAFEMSRMGDNPPPHTVCIPDNVTGDQIIAIALNYLQAHPNRSYWPGAVLVWNALIEKYPCP